MNKYLSGDELEENLDDKGNDKEYPIKIMNNAYFSWDENVDKSDCILKDINLKVKKGSLIAVVGAVGSGEFLNFYQVNLF